MQVNIKDWPIYLLYLMPIAILSGPFFSDLFLIIIDFWFLIKIAKNSLWKEKYIKNYFFLFFVLFNVYIILVSLNSENILFSLKASFFYFRFYVFSFAIFFIFENYKVSIKYFFYSICLSIIMIILSSIYDLVVLKDFFNNVRPELGEYYRVSGLFGDELIMGSILKSFFAIFLVIFSYLNFFKKKVINFFTIILILWTVSFTILISGERVSIFAFAIFCIFSGLILREKINFNKIVLLTVISSLLLFLSFDHLRGRIIDATFEQVSNKQKLFDNKGNEIKRDLEKFVYLSVHHDAHARSAIQMFSSKPIFGHGPKYYRKICKDYEYNQFSCTTHPHNIYLQLLSETGIIGFLFLLFALVSIIFLLNKKFNQENNISIKILSTYILIYFIPFIPSGNFFNNFVNINFYMIFGLYLFMLNYNKERVK